MFSHFTFVSFRLLFLIAASIVAVAVMAQQAHCVIIDKETGVPVRDVKVATDKGAVALTNYLGQVTVEGDFTSATISHASYLQRRVDRKEFRDTLWLLPRVNRLAEVVVLGENQRGIKSIVKSATEGLEGYAPPRGVVEFDFFKLFEKKPLSRKARKKNRELLRGWDETYGKNQNSEADVAK